MIESHSTIGPQSMTRSRRMLVRPETTPYYHCFNRCVRRAFLCGEDPVTGRNFEHRRQWMVDRITLLAEVFAVDICAYAIMSNHYHLTVRLAPERVQHWSESEVCDRWMRVFSGPAVIRRWRDNADLTPEERVEVASVLNCWRDRLADLSWFMRCLNENIARRANEEDGCTGRFWEGRFKSQALLDERALVAGMVYVDLNPIRANLADTLEPSYYTSIPARIRQLARRGAPPRWVPPRAERSVRLVPLGGDAEGAEPLPFAFRDYLAAAEWAAHGVQAEKGGAELRDAPRLMRRVGIRAGPFVEHLRAARPAFHDVVGSADAMRAAAKTLGRSFVKGTSAAERLFVSAEQEQESATSQPLQDRKRRY
jgi:REP element-mobilizing transposase RayT